MKEFLTLKNKISVRIGELEGKAGELFERGVFVAERSSQDVNKKAMIIAEAMIKNLSLETESMSELLEQNTRRTINNDIIMQIIKISRSGERLKYHLEFLKIYFKELVNLINRTEKEVKLMEILSKLTDETIPFDSDKEVNNVLEIFTQLRKILLAIESDSKALEVGFNFFLSYVGYDMSVEQYHSFFVRYMKTKFKDIDRIKFLKEELETVIVANQENTKLVGQYAEDIGIEISKMKREILILYPN